MYTTSRRPRAVAIAPLALTDMTRRAATLTRGRSPAIAGAPAAYPAPRKLKEGALSTADMIDPEVADVEMPRMNDGSSAGEPRSWTASDGASESIALRTPFIGAAAAGMGERDSDGGVSKGFVEPAVQDSSNATRSSVVLKLTPLIEALAGASRRAFAPTYRCADKLKRYRGSVIERKHRKGILKQYSRAGYRVPLQGPVTRHDSRRKH